MTLLLVCVIMFIKCVSDPLPIDARNPDVVIATGHLFVPPSNFVVPETTECWDDDGECTYAAPVSSLEHTLSYTLLVLYFYDL